MIVLFCLYILCNAYRCCVLFQPSLHPRPTGPLSGTPSQIPPNAGPVTEQINKVAGKLVDFMRNSLEDIFKELATHGSPEAMIKALQVS